MPAEHRDRSFGSTPPEVYERFFVPAIAEPLARDLLEIAAIETGERVLDAGCGTGVVARMAAEQVGLDGSVVGLDVNPGMLAVAKAVAPVDLPLEWREASAEALPFPDQSFDVVTCQMSLQFVPDRQAALREMRRVLAPGGRLVLNSPGPAGPVFAALSSALARHVGPEAAGFVRQVFSMHDVAALRDLLDGVAFREASVRAVNKDLILPPAAEFLWQYVYGTPLAELVQATDEESRAALEDDVVRAWRPFVVEAGDRMECSQRMLLATARG